MKKLPILFALSGLILCMSFRTEDDLSFVKSFVRDLSSNHYQSKTIISNYFCTMSEENHEEKLKVIEIQLKSIHKYLLMGGVKIEKYSAIPAKDQNIIIEEAKKKDIYRVSGRQGLIFFILMENKQISSISTLNKGGSRVIIKICD
ncbi:hypothetical protein [Mucilaginibacter paludis]|uniref:Uncharacterized protein n=1 Tax=Mucilaginibacter paludis DSM 18603 TaxID=714943 RepID=H1Y5T9_9SPHI|nr:hypothetical protein [Mucilaginibacter paludis]EHQ30361.1 hypothetical protein Mucpa_6305 [Mucilaginibacter paludis DSM 18603]